MLRKQWSLQSFACLADLIQNETDLNVVLLWGPKEKKQVEIVDNEMKTDPLLSPPTDLSQAAALVKTCKLLICNDGGLNHLSVTTKTPTLAIFGTIEPKVWSPASKFSHHFHLHDPDFDSFQDNSFGISAQNVFDEVKRILNLKLNN
ncbi:MAG: glycosyltransferase family 9 protein [Fibrobacter sp.]|nr:glycosyltransferase family 9 protein [Fibrobacter sp.]